MTLDQLRALKPGDVVIYRETGQRMTVVLACHPEGNFLSALDGPDEYSEYTADELDNVDTETPGMFGEEE